MPGPSKPLTRNRAWTCLLVNQLATPGLGSMMGKHYLAGTGQLLLALAGFGLLMFWLLKYFYGMAFQPLDAPAPTGPYYGWTGIAGVLCFLVSWIWSGVTSLALLRQAKIEDPAPLPGLPPLKPDAAPRPPEPPR